MKIQKLPKEAISKLESGLIITDVVQCALELVHNALDAEATGIAVRIDLKNFQIRVIDNGRGIGREDLELVGEKYMTSKYYDFLNMDSALPKYGFRGQALSSLKDVCKTLTIETKPEDDGPSFVKVLQNNKSSEISEGNGGRNGTGTTVTVDDFMCTMPVRRKRINELFDMEEVKNQLQYLAIIHYNVCFTLRNDNKGIILLQTPQASNMLESVSNIFGKTVAKSLKALQYKEKEIEITGFISLKPQIHSNVQLLYINQRLVTKGITHKFINNVIKEYVGKSIFYGDSPRDQVLRSLRSCCHNIFIVKIQCPYSDFELFKNLRKTTVEFRNWKVVLKCVHKAVKRAFKDVLNLDNSSVIQEKDDISNTKADKCRGVFGTSVLMNAVKGAAVKRGFTIKKDNRKPKKKNLSKMKDKPYIQKTEGYKKPVDEELTDLSQLKGISHDSLESPIPRNLLEKAKPNFEIRNTDIVNQFFEFFEWIRTTFETDETAFFKLYNDFLKFKNGKKYSMPPKEVTNFKSPILGVKLKRKKVVSPKKLKKKRERMGEDASDCLHAAAKEMVVTHQQPKICKTSHLRMEKAIKFTQQKNNNFLEYSNFDSAKSRGNLLQGDSRSADFSHSFTLTSSEIQLTNIIKFRNWSEPYPQQHSSVIYKDKPIGNTYVSRNFSSWESHYQNFTSKNVEFIRQGLSSINVPVLGNDLFQTHEVTERNSLHDAHVSFCPGEIRTTKGSQGCQDVEIQVNLSKVILEKMNAMVQTSPKDSLIQKFPNNESMNGIDQGIRKAITEKAGFGQTGTTDRSQEVPSPDFWNISAQGYCGNTVELDSDLDEVITKMSKLTVSNETNSLSSGFICGQKSNSADKEQNEGSISRETQTLAAIWPDSLTEKINTAADSNSKSESTVLKTIPLEEIEFKVFQPVESEFCLTERHDFIPKGLSPAFFLSKSNKTFTLTPREKNRVKVTVENARNDLLATVKWQDECTGDHLNHAIPNAIVQEMRQKVEENALNLENPILSASLSYCAVKVHNLLKSFAFTKELLSSIEVLGQLDKKFIVTKMKLSTPKTMELISLFDQHAVDERIKLEELVKNYSLPDGSFITSRLNSAVPCVLNESAVRIICDLNERLLNFGLNVKKVNENTVSINEVPKFLLNKHEKDLKNKKDVSLSDVLKALILNIVEEMKETRGTLSKIPKVMHDAFCLEACHKAIKFNRELSLEKMTEMIKELKSCKLPFQCAHGRPSVIPIIDLEDFKVLMQENDRIELEKIKKFRANLENIHPKS